MGDTLEPVLPGRHCNGVANSRAVAEGAHKMPEVRTPDHRHRVHLCLLWIPHPNLPPEENSATRGPAVSCCLSEVSCDYVRGFHFAWRAQCPFGTARSVGIVCISCDCKAFLPNMAE